MDVHVWANDLIWDDLGHYLMLEELFERPDSEFYRLSAFGRGYCDSITMLGQVSGTL